MAASETRELEFTQLGLFDPVPLVPAAGAIPLDELSFSVIDVETTGFSPARGDRVIQLAAVRATLADGIVDSYAHVIDPQRDIPWRSSEIHGIYEHDVLDAPTFGQIAPELMATIDGTVLAGHNFAFDWSFLQAEFAAAGRSLHDWPRLCTRHMREWVGLPKLRPNTLPDACRAQGVALHGHHDAVADATATALLLLSYLRHADAEGVRTLDDLPEQLPTTEFAADHLAPEWTRLRASWASRMSPLL